MATVVYKPCRKQKHEKQIISNFQRSPTRPFQNLNDSFRENVKWFLQNSCEVEDYCVDGHTTWYTLLGSDQDDHVFPFFTVEEDLQSSDDPHCHLCKLVGWGNHFVTKRRYHFIIPRACDWENPLEDDSLESDTHILHGMIHCNGFGHILTLQGGDDSSKFVPPGEIMNLWDTLCKTLRTRKITVHDVCKTNSMDLRLIYGVAHRSSWFGKWGYRFCAGSFGVTEKKYNRANEILNSIALERIADDFVGDSLSCLAVQHIIRSYTDTSETRLRTIGDFFQYMLDSNKKLHVIKMGNGTLRMNSPELSNNSNKSLSQDCKLGGNANCEDITATSDSRWPAKKLEHGANVIADILEKNTTQTSGMSRHDLRESARQHIGDTGLIDYVLKIIGDKVVGSNVIRRTSNPATKTLEFSIEKFEACTEPEDEFFEPGKDVWDDILHLYNKVLLSYPEEDPISLAAVTVLNSKFFVKEWKISSLQDPDDRLLAICQLMPSYNELNTFLTQPLPPGEVILLQKNVTNEELKMQAQTVLRDTYFLTRNFVVEDIKINGWQSKEDEVLELIVRGTGLDLESPLRYEENAADDEKVNCDCGANEDDGERMVSCTACNVWQHTSCNDIQDDEVPEPLFFCGKCRSRRL